MAETYLANDSSKHVPLVPNERELEIVVGFTVPSINVRVRVVMRDYLERPI